MARPSAAKAAKKQSLKTLMELQKDANPRVRLAAARAAGELANKIQMDELESKLREMERVVYGDEETHSV